MALLDFLSPSRKVRQDSEALRENNHRELIATQRLEELGTLCVICAYLWFIKNNASLDACGNRMELRSNKKKKIKKILFAKRSCSGEAGSSDQRKRCLNTGPAG